MVYCYFVFDLIDKLLKEKFSVKGVLGILLGIKFIYKKNIKEVFLKIKNKLKNIEINSDDIFVFLEVYGLNVVEILRGNKKIIYN